MIFGEKNKRSSVRAGGPTYLELFFYLKHWDHCHPFKINGLPPRTWANTCHIMSYHAPYSTTNWYVYLCIRERDVIVQPLDIVELYNYVQSFATLNVLELHTLVIFFQVMFKLNVLTAWLQVDPQKGQWPLLCKVRHLLGIVLPGSFLPWFGHPRPHPHPPNNLRRPCARVIQWYNVTYIDIL